jgi:hypothetical protein
MGLTTNSILTSNRSNVCGVMNEFVILESKRQHNNLLLTLYFNFNKLEALLSLAQILTMKPPWRIFLPWEMNTFTQGDFG